MPRCAQACRKILTSKAFLALKEAFQAQFSGFKQGAQLREDPFQLKRVVLVARLGRRDGQRQALIVGQKQGIGRAAGFAPLIANGRPAVLGQRVAAVELNAG